MTHRSIPIVAALLLSGSAAAARDRSVVPKPSPYIDALGACRPVVGDAERAACYDKAYDALVTARARKDIVVVDREGMRETRKGLFGFSLPGLPFFGGGDDDDNDVDAPKQVDSTIKAVSSAGKGLYRIRLADGALWQTTDELTGLPKPGGEIHIRRGSLNSYLLSLKNGRAVRAIRIQ